MKWTIEASNNPAIFRIRMEERATVLDVEQMWGEILGHSDWNSELGVMFDDAELDPSGLTTADLQRLGSFFKGLTPRLATARIALLTATTFKYGLARQFVALAATKNPVSMNVFRDEADAMRWLGAGGGDH